jgi:hypothetical protein
MVYARAAAAVLVSLLLAAGACAALIYSLHFKIFVIFGFCATRLTRFVENTCNIYISK